ncbi:MAG: hypothetical protein HY741_20685 [Chloroflexi bacterium]|nr:hypothetical protein [Chloroflexota bacterium]
MILAAAASILILYFAFFLGVSGLAKLDRPYVEPRGEGRQARLIGLFFSPVASRLFGVLEIVLAFLLAFGVRIEFVALVNAGLFSLFLAFKLFLMITRQGSSCGCFGTHELIAVDLSSVITSTLIFGIAVILAVVAQQSSIHIFNWVVQIIFSALFGWIVFKVFARWRLENRAIRRISINSLG